MRFWSGVGIAHRAVPAALVAAAVLMSAGCNMDEVTMPAIGGPATHALSLVLTASPDVVMTDGVSTSVVVATLRGPDGRGVSGREIVLMQLDPSGGEAEVGTLSARRVTTGSDGRASVIFRAPGPESYNAHAYVTIQGRIVDNDAQGRTYYGVRIELIPEHLRRYPEGENELPVCNYVTEPRWGYFYVGVPIRFQSTSWDPDGYIVRHEWRFGDGTDREYEPDLYHTYWLPQVYFPALSVRDNLGAFESCDRRLQVWAAP